MKKKQGKVIYHEPADLFKITQNYQKSFGNIDPKRINIARSELTNKINKEHQKQVQVKQAIKMNQFRQSARNQQRQFHQQNHQYLRMFTVMSSSAFDANKFTISASKQSTQVKNTKGANKTQKETQKIATLHLNLDTQFSSSITTKKFTIQSAYNIVPYKRESIQFQSKYYLNSNYLFFVFQPSKQKSEQVRKKLVNQLDDSHTSQFKASVIRAVGQLDFFQYIELINKKNIQHRIHKGPQFSQQLIELARQSSIFQIDSDQRELYIRGPIQVTQHQTNQRLVSCQENDLRETSPSLYFQKIAEYTSYKKYRMNEYKSFKIFSKDVSINTDIRNIISSQKIYIIELISQVQLYIKLSKQTPSLDLMYQIFDQLKKKRNQFLQLLCGYTESNILSKYNIQSYHQKIQEFIQKSIRYKKQYVHVNENIFQEFPVLEIWYKLPAILFGYTRETLHKKFYDITSAIIDYQQRIKDFQLMQKLKIKRKQVRYYC